MEESRLISKAENYLSEIGEDKIVLDNIDDFEYFKELYFKLDDRLDKLLEFKDSMDSQGYKSPFKSLNKYGTGTIGEISLEEVSENSRHNQIFRMRANAKKNILERVKSAIDSHQIAIGNLNNYANIKCETCYKQYKIDEYKQLDGKCSCGCENFSFKVNKDKTHRIEIIPYLPLSGNYMVLMSQFSNWGRDAFKKVLNFLKQERKGLVKTISLVIKFKDKNKRWIRKNVTLDSEFIDNYEEEVRRIYGKDVRIEMLRFHRSKPAIIDDKNARNALAIAYVKYGEELVNEIRDSLLKRNISDFKRINKYDEIIAKYENNVPFFIEKNDIEGLEIWRNSEIEREFKELGYMDSFGNLTRSLKRDLKKRENIEKNIFTHIPVILIMWDIFKYYLTTSYHNRKYANGPFPRIRVNLDRQQRKAFQTNYNSVISILNRETNLKIISIPEMDLILHEKFHLEKLISDSNIKVNNPALGAALINHMNSDIDTKSLGNAFNINESKINKEVKNIEKLKKPKSEKSKKFLELIKK
ncbi:MAG: DUF530 domain-containing protein [Methanobrevibacter sp.]|uniref:DUF530 domain-containing protein n=1 Tax=Methanobrevibacter sp. TaxID=66852 RepID=UPI0026E02765|nr:DUF530 domain-containing protein [Methanobrevibacter sp.]MDO5849249.1 DUF530 domain-containing protein [Methanobrevibacter sp.]